MSDLMLPQYLKDLIKQEKDLTGETIDSPGDEDKARQLPKPTGHKILCAIPPAGDTFEDTKIKTDSQAVLGVKKVILFWFVLTAVLDSKFTDVISV